MKGFEEMAPLVPTKSDGGNDPRQSDGQGQRQGWQEGLQQRVYRKKGVLVLQNALIKEGLLLLSHVLETI